MLCIIAFDTLHAWRTQRPLRPDRVELLAEFLDFAACANASVDHKLFCCRDYQSARQHLENAGLSAVIDEYLQQLEKVELDRPAAGDSFDEMQAYREEVVRISLGTVAAIAFEQQCVDVGIQATHDDADLQLLLSIIMQWQLLDDALDYAEDSAAGLPSFLTAGDSLERSTRAAVQTARAYAACR